MKGIVNWFMDKIQKYPIIEGMLFIFGIIGVYVIYNIRASIPSAQEIVLYITFVAIAYYTVVQWKLKNLTSKQITLNIRPLIVCGIEDFDCSIKNVGNGVAINIRGDIFPITKEQGENFRIKPDAKFITSGDMRCLEAHSEWHDIGMRLLDEDGKAVGGYSYTPGKSIISSLNQITIYYEDIEGTQYKTEMLREHERFRIKRFS